MSEFKPRFVAAGYHVFDAIDSPAVTVAECLPGGEDGQGWARRVADALNDSIEYSWSGEGPTIAEAGGRTILIRIGEDLTLAKYFETGEPADAVGGTSKGEWYCFRASGHWLARAACPTGWRRMPKARE